ncbi:MAG: hypothetical protein MJK15_03230 [Colwellia sp.]|nr:hypothetical protein [Colwellia sp.]
MSRTTPDEVKEIIATELTDPILQIWIDAASTIVDDAAECIGGDNTLLTQVELYLSAHFVALENAASGGGELTSFKITNQLAETYNVYSLQGNILDTTYGRTANMLSKGCLILIGKEKATVNFL